MLIKRIFVIASLLASTGLCNAQPQTKLPSFDQINPVYATTVQDQDDESIDPFLGALRLRNVDLHLPGQGGFALDVVRAYSSARVAREGMAENDPYTPKALGWTVHFGRILVRFRNCSGSSSDTNYMPLLETPDGTRRIVWGTAQTGSPAMMTQDKWSVSCNGSGYLVTDPNGTRYDMQYVQSTGYTTCPNPLHPDEQCTLTMYSTTKVTDKNGNYATISYQTYANPRVQPSQRVWNEPQVTQVTANDGRTLTFGYAIYGTTEETKKPYLTSIAAGTGERINYGYTLIGNLFGNDTYALTTAQDPVGRTWTYQYQIPRVVTDWRCNVQIDCPIAAGDLLLKSVTTPWGGVRNYTWVALAVRNGEPATSTPVAVATKSTSDGGAWTYSYSYDKANLRQVTTLNGPQGQVTFYHRRELFDTNSIGTRPSGWTNGLLLYQVDGTTQSSTFVWKGQPISNSWASLSDMVTPAAPSAVRPIMVSKSIVRDGAAYGTSFSDFDIFGNPGTVTETGVNGGSRTTSLTYFNDTSKWIIGVTNNETFTGASTQRMRDANGNLTSYTRDGVTTTFAYDSQGNLSQKTLPRGLIHAYSNYKRGIPQTETQPEGVTLLRVVNDSGLVTSATNGEGRTTTYTYDANGREKSATYPLGNPKATVYSATTKTVTRGSLVEATLYDGFGRPLSVTVGGIKTTYAHDPLGRKTFESDPAATTGTSYQYDVLGRLTRVTRADGSYQVHAYGAAAKSVTDERGRTSTYVYRSYGDPSHRFLMGIYAAEASANVSITRDVRDQVTSVVQGGISRTYAYNANYYLVSTWNPEVGTTVFGRDIAGNMTSRSVGGSGDTTISYDGQNRVSSIAYPFSAPSVTYSYTKTNKLLWASSAAAVRTLGYDANDNLTGDTLSVDGSTFAAAYGFNGNDQLASVTYPLTGNVVSYSPDVLGRPTQVSGYVTGVAYWPSGLLKQINYANGTVSNYGQNVRLWPSTFTTFKNAGATYVNSAYGYDAVGNLTSISDTVDAAYSRGLAYDNLDRVTGANGPWGGGTIAYDGVGNLLSQSFGGSSLSYSYDANNRLAGLSGARNTSFTYDVYGNIKAGSGNQYGYDGVPLLRCVNCGTSTDTSYAYDGVNRRISVTKAGVKTYEMYGGEGNPLVEYTPSTNRVVEYIYLGGKRIAQRATPF